MASTLYTTAAAGLIDKNTLILSATSSTDPSLWHRVHPGVRNIGFQLKLSSTASAEELMTGAVEIQASNDGVTPLATLLGTISLSSAVQPASDGLAIDTHWGYVRSVISSGTTMSSGTSVEVLASPHIIRM